MSAHSNRPDFYDETVINTNNYADVLRNVQTKVFSVSEPIDIAEPNNVEKISDVRPWRVSFNIQHSKVELVFEVIDQIFIGRSARPDQSFDGIDLSPFEGHEMGISRLHAEIRREKEHVVLIDKGSSNGTLLNQQKLEEDTPYVIRHGDEIWFGKMSVSVNFLTPIFAAS